MPCAEVLVQESRKRVIVDACPVRASLHTSATTDATVYIGLDDALLIYINSMCGTYLDALSASEAISGAYRRRRLPAHQRFVRDIPLDIKRRNREICSLQLR